MKKIIYIIILFSIFVVVFYKVFFTSSESKIKHRLQWWRSEIGLQDIQENGKTVKIAVVDSGVDVKCPDLKNTNIIEHKVISESGKDEIGTQHGTALISIISGFPHNEKGILGINNNTVIYSIDVTDEELVSIDALIRGIDLAIQERVDIINISVGINEDSDKLYDVIKKAVDNNIIVIASAGNYINDGNILYPAKYTKVIAVGSYGKDGEIITPLPYNNNVYYLPGENIVTCLGDNEYAGCYGTSFSTAIMTGLISNVISNYDIKDNEVIYRALININKESKKIDQNEIYKYIERELK